MEYMHIEVAVISGRRFGIEMHALVGSSIGELKALIVDRYRHILQRHHRAGTVLSVGNQTITVGGQPLDDQEMVERSALTRAIGLVTFGDD